MAAYQAAPGIKFSVGQSHQEAQQLSRDLGEIKKQLQGIQAEAKQTASALNDVLRGAKGSRGTGAPGQATTPTGGQPRQAGTRRQASPAANADRNIFAGMQGHVGMSDAEWRELGKKQAQRREQALKAGMELTPTERREYSRTRAVNASIRARGGEGLLGRAVQAAGWSPFMPPQMYYAQMALESLGLPMGAVAGGLGVAGLGAGALALNAYATAQARTGQQLYSAAGSPFTPATYTTGADMTRLLQQRTGANGLNLPGNEGQQAVSALAAGGLSGSAAFGQALDQTATLVNAFGLSVQDAADYVAAMRVQLGQTTDQTAMALAAFGKVAQDTGQPLSALGQIITEMPNLLANLTNPADQAAVASMYRSLGGSTPGALGLANPLNVAGAPALSIAGQLGYTPKEFDQLKTTAKGQAQIADRTIQKLQQFYSDSGGVEDVAMIRAQALLGSGLTQQQFDRLRKLAPNAGAAALNQALAAPAPTAAPGSAASVNAQIAAGNFAGASRTANPPSVPSMTVNAAQVFLTGASGQAATAAQLIAHGGSFTDAQLHQVAANGGVDAALANAQLLRRGNMGALGPLARQLASGMLSAASVAAKPEDSTVAAMLQRAAQAVSGSPSPPGNGGGGQVITINLQTDGRQIAQLPVKIGPNQQFNQYVPNYHAPGRGPQ